MTSSAEIKSDIHFITIKSIVFLFSVFILASLYCFRLVFVFCLVGMTNILMASLKAALQRSYCSGHM